GAGGPATRRRGGTPRRREGPGKRTRRSTCHSWHALAREGTRRKCKRSSGCCSVRCQIVTMRWGVRREGPSRDLAQADTHVGPTARTVRQLPSGHPKFRDRGTQVAAEAL